MIGAHNFRNYKELCRSDLFPSQITVASQLMIAHRVTMLITPKRKYQLFNRRKYEDSNSECEVQKQPKKRIPTPAPLGGNHEALELQCLRSKLVGLDHLGFGNVAKIWHGLGFYGSLSLWSTQLRIGWIQRSWGIGEGLSFNIKCENMFQRSGCLLRSSYMRISACELWMKSMPSASIKLTKVGR